MRKKRKASTDLAPISEEKTFNLVDDYSLIHQLILTQAKQHLFVNDFYQSILPELPETPSKISSIQLSRLLQRIGSWVHCYTLCTPLMKASDAQEFEPLDNFFYKEHQLHTIALKFFEQVLEKSLVLIKKIEYFSYRGFLDLPPLEEKQKYINKDTYKNSQYKIHFFQLAIIFSSRLKELAIRFIVALYQHDRSFLGLPPQNFCIYPIVKIVSPIKYDCIYLTANCNPSLLKLFDLGPSWAGFLTEKADISPMRTAVLQKNFSNIEFLLDHKAEFDFSSLAFSLCVRTHKSVDDFPRVPLYEMYLFLEFFGEELKNEGTRLTTETILVKLFILLINKYGGLDHDPETELKDVAISKDYLSLLWKLVSGAFNFNKPLDALNLFLPPVIKEMVSEYYFSYSLFISKAKFRNPDTQEYYLSSTPTLRGQNQ